jgi:hypothetical protein
LHQERKRKTDGTKVPESRRNHPLWAGLTGVLRQAAEKSTAKTKRSAEVKKNLSERMAKEPRA